MDSHKVLGAGGEFADVVQFVETVRQSPPARPRAELTAASDSQEHEAVRAEQRRASFDACCSALHPR
jgi:hypothetical protein